MLRPRHAWAITVVFAVIAAIYGWVSRDAGGATTLAALAIGMGVMSYVLIAGSREL